MSLRASFVTMVKIAATAIAISSGSACGPGASGKLAVDSPAMPYQAPDIDEITGIDPDDAGSGSGSSEQK